MAKAKLSVFSTKNEIATDIESLRNNKEILNQQINDIYSELGDVRETMNIFLLKNTLILASGWLLFIISLLI